MAGFASGQHSPNSRLSALRSRISNLRSGESSALESYLSQASGKGSEEALGAQRLSETQNWSRAGQTSGCLLGASFLFASSLSPKPRPGRRPNSPPIVRRPHRSCRHARWAWFRISGPRNTWRLAGSSGRSRKLVLATSLYFITPLPAAGLGGRIKRADSNLIDRPMVFRRPAELAVAAAAVAIDLRPHRADFRREGRIFGRRHANSAIRRSHCGHICKWGRRRLAH